MKPLHVTIIGGTGFVGRHLATLLLDRGHVLTLVSRHAPDENSGFEPGDKLRWLEGDLLNSASLSEAVVDADAVVNLVGAVSLQNEQAYFDLHELGARRVAEAARDEKVKQLIHISALGVDRAAPSAADRSKAAGEIAVRQTFPTAVIVRPSLIFGPDDHFLSLFERLSRSLPLIPLIGAKTRFQPLHVDDVSTALVCLLENPGNRDKRYQLGGPEVFPLHQIVRHLMSSLHRKRLILPLPYAIAMPLAILLSPVPNAPINHHVTTLMMTDKTVEPGVSSILDLGISPRTLREWLGNRN